MGTVPDSLLQTMDGWVDGWSHSRGVPRPQPDDLLVKFPGDPEVWLPRFRLGA